MDVHKAATSAAKELSYQDLKLDQMKVVEAFVKGRDVFAVLPTGYGKSLCYGCLPMVFDKLLGVPEDHKSIIVVVTQLTEIMKDQVKLYTYSQL